MRSHAPMRLSVSEKEKRAGVSAWLCCTSGMFYGWSGHGCLVEMSEQEQQWGHSATASIVTSEMQCSYMFLN